MAMTDITANLRRHAGLDSEVNDESTPSIAECTWSRGPARGRLAEGVEDFVATLSALNNELNGPVPSESERGADDIPRDVAYAVAEVIRMLRDAAESPATADEIQRMADAAWSIETAWRALLAGDVDDLEQHVVEERSARG